MNQSLIKKLLKKKYWLISREDFCKLQVTAEDLDKFMTFFKEPLKSNEFCVLPKTISILEHEKGTEIEKYANIYKMARSEANVHWTWVRVHSLAREWDVSDYTTRTNKHITLQELNNEFCKSCKWEKLTQHYKLALENLRAKK